jgi:outer membrane protein assembly factor BamB
MWTREVTTSTDTPAVAAAGKVFVTASDEHRVLALHQKSGRLAWKRRLRTNESAPTFGNDTVYWAFGCPNVYALNPANGNTRWARTWGCSGGITASSAYHGDRLYVNDHVSDSGLIYDADTGNLTDSYYSTRWPAIHEDRAVYFSYDHLVGVDRDTQTIEWSFDGDGSLYSAPIIVRDHVYVGSEAGHFYALDALDGRRVWRADLKWPIWGSTAGMGRVLAWGDKRIVAFGAAP